jgi:LruC domain-containing protein
MPRHRHRTSLLLAATLSAPLGLTGYTLNGSSQITWRYVGQTATLVSPYTAAGVPAHAGHAGGYTADLPVPSLPTDFTGRIAVMLPEKVDIRSNTQIALSSDDQTNLTLSQDADVWVTFINEGAGFSNSMGFFTFDPANPPRTPLEVADEQIILPNASVPPLAKAAGQGATVSLGRVPAGRGIGFFVVANGWAPNGRSVNGVKVPGVREAIDRNWIYYSLKGLNPEPADSRHLNQHTVLLQDTTVTGTDNRPYQRLVLAFEDYLRTSGSDHDFNDLVLAVHVSPASAVANLAGIPRLVASATDGDRDGDGVRDSVDEFADDPRAAFSRWFPGSGSWGTLAYEDNWPQLGDHDLNDVVIRYRSREILSAARQVSGLEMDLRLDARGGTFRSGFAVALPGISAAQVQSASLQRPDGQTVAISPQPGQTDAVFDVFADSHVWAPPPGGGGACGVYVNTAADCPVLPPSTFQLRVQLVAPVAAFPPVPYDPFIYRTDDPGVEVHLSGQQPSRRARTALLGTGADASVAGTVSTYRTALGLPWALHIPGAWVHPAEFVDVVRVYPRIADWAASGGSRSADWYAAPSDRSLTFLNGR